MAPWAEAYASLGCEEGMERGEKHVGTAVYSRNLGRRGSVLQHDVSCQNNKVLLMFTNIQYDNPQSFTSSCILSN